MKTLKQLITNGQAKRQPLPLFSKLKELKLQQPKTEKIHGITLVDSDASDDQGTTSQAIMLIRSNLQKYKHDKAMQLVYRHQRTQQSIDEIANLLKDQYRHQALCIIDSKYRHSSAERFFKSPQEQGSTLPNSTDKDPNIETPGFDHPSHPCDRSADLKQFTLGQQNSNTSAKAYHQDDSTVSQFQILNRQTASRRIKNKIMNPKPMHQ